MNIKEVESENLVKAKYNERLNENAIPGYNLLSMPTFPTSISLYILKSKSAFIAKKSGKHLFRNKQRVQS